uniref:Cell cycle regulatory protein n=1 Tax=Ganoderma boninense TaxID=34458 RepID=A0A5K1K145_9APHY|nr:Cell cycle regulatory protein [Ganoderma boninense]
MPPTTRISRNEALAVLDDQRAQIETLCLQLCGDEQEALHPLGFPQNPDQWHSSVPRVVRRLNLEYRHDCKFDIIEGARKIRRTHVSYNELMTRLATCREMRATISDLDVELRNLYTARMPQLSLPLVSHFGDVMPTIAASVALVHEFVDSVEESISTYAPTLEVMTMSKEEISVFAIRLTKPVSPKEYILGVRPLLAQLRELHTKRVDIEARSKHIHSRIRASFMSRTYLTPPELHTELAEYTDLVDALEDQEKSQQDLLEQAKVYFDDIASSPTAVPGLLLGTFLDIATLREAHVIYRQILDSLQMMEKLYVPLKHAMTCVETHIRRGVPMEMTEELFSFARFLPS